MPRYKFPKGHRQNRQVSGLAGDPVLKTLIAAMETDPRSLFELAMESGWSESAISRFRKLPHNPNYRMVRDLGQTLGLKLEWK